MSQTFPVTCPQEARQLMLEGREEVFTKTTPTWKMARVEIVATMLARGMEVRHIRKMAEKKGWGCGEKQLQRLCQLARRIAIRRMRSTAANAWQDCLLRNKEIYRQAIEKGDLRTALHSTQELAKLHGLYPEERKRLEIEHKGELKVAHAHAFFADVQRYEDEFRLAARAERLEREHTAVTAEDREGAGFRLSARERNADPNAKITHEADDSALSPEPVLEDIEESDISSENLLPPDVPSL